MNPQNKNNIPQGYKTTPLGIIPQEWEVEPLHYLGQIYSGGTPDTEVEEYWNGDIAWCTPSDITKLTTKYIECTDVKITGRGLKESSATLLPPQSIVVCTRATIGNAAICTTDIATNQGFKNIIPNKETNSEWLYYMIIYSKPRLVRLGCGSTFLEVSKKDFSRFKILVPPLAEQKKIAEVLGTWDKAIEKQTQLIKKLELRKKGLMQHLLTGKKRLPGFSGEWKKVRLGDITIFLSTNSFSREQLNNVKGNILNIHYGDVLVRYSSVLDVSKEDIPYINEQIEYSPKDYVNNGDIIMADTAEDEMVGRCCEVINIDNTKVVSGLHTILIHPIIKFAPKYLGYYLNSEKYHKQIISIMQGIKVYSITKDALRNTTIDIPCIEEQTGIATILSLCDNKILLAKQKLEKYRQQKKGLMQVLLTGKKRVL